MTQPSQIKSLTTLVTLRERAVDKLTAELAAKERERERYRSNLERMAGLCASGSSASVAPMAISLNSALNHGHYKQTVLQMADAHRTDLALHEADMAVTKRALAAAAGKREVMGQVLAQQKEQWRGVQNKADQKRQDDMASQLWARNQT